MGHMVRWQSEVDRFKKYFLHALFRVIYSTCNSPPSSDLRQRPVMAKLQKKITLDFRCKPGLIIKGSCKALYARDIRTIALLYSIVRLLQTHYSAFHQIATRTAFDDCLWYLSYVSSFFTVRASVFENQIA